MLATWKPMISDGPMRDGDAAYHASARTPAVLVNEATLASLGLEAGSPVRVTTDHGSVVLQVGRADLDDDVVFVPNGVAGLNVTRDLGVRPGGRVSLEAVDTALTTTGGQSWL